MEKSSAEQTKKLRENGNQKYGTEKGKQGSTARHADLRRDTETGATSKRHCVLPHVVAATRRREGRCHSVKRKGRGGKKGKKGGTQLQL